MCDSSSYVVAVDITKPDGFEFYEILLLSATVDSEPVGFLCICPTRVENVKFLDWFLRNIAVKATEKPQDVYRLLSHSNESRPHTFVTCDGAAIVLQQVLQKDTREIQQKRNSEIGEIAVSCNGILQPADVSPLFRASKSHLKGLL